MSSQLPAQTILQRIGAGDSIQSVCTAAGFTPAQFDAWWQEELTSRLPETVGTIPAPTKHDVEILRDDRGIPHIFAENEQDLYFAFGYAMAQDRLWQLDYLRRKAMGKLSEILGSDALDQDVLVRTVGINRIAVRELERLPSHTRQLLQSFSQGVNALIEASHDHLPIEFALLDYTPEPWSPLDCVAIWGEFRWYLTGRLPVIVLPELAKRTLGDGALYQAFLKGEAEDESIIPLGSYGSRTFGTERVGDTVGDPDEGIGSNHWVVAGSRSTTGSPMVASDPHIAFGTLSCWYEVHLSGGPFNVAGMTYVGVPAVLFGRNEHVAWGITNNICSQRDLYQEQTDPQHPGSFLYDNVWQPARQLTEQIAVRGSEPVDKVIRFSRNGPIVDELLPKPGRNTGPVSLRWLGATFCDELSCLHNANRARSCDQFRESLRGWRVPTWSFVFADVDGHIDYQCAGRIPIRKGWERGYRSGWDPEHQWQGLIPYDAMPNLADPAQGWIRSANNRTAPEDFPYPLSGTWGSGHRAMRIRHMLEEKETFSLADFERMQQDVLSQRAVENVPGLLRGLAHVEDEGIQHALDILRAWNCRMEMNQAGASIFDIFYRRWSYTVAAERFPDEMAVMMADGIGGLSQTLLEEDTIGWFPLGERAQKLLNAFRWTLRELENRLGPDPLLWTWNRLHTITLHHPLSHRGDLSQLLDSDTHPVAGNGFTVCNTGYGADYRASAGASYRLIADLGASPAALWAVDAAGQSGHPGSVHYCDQLQDWLQARYSLPLERSNVMEKSKLLLSPQTK